MKHIFSIFSTFFLLNFLSAQPVVNSTRIYNEASGSLYADTDEVMHGTPIRLAVTATPKSGTNIERVEFYRYGTFIGEGVLNAAGEWSLNTEATVPVFSASDEPSTTLIDFDKGNGSFEDWSGTLPAGWFRGRGGYSTKKYGYIPLLPVTRVTTDAHSGLVSAKITGVRAATGTDGNYTMRNWGNVWFYNNIGMSVWNPYWITFYAKQISGDPGDKLEVGAGYGNTFEGGLTYTETDGDWQPYGFLATPAAPPLGDADQIVFTSRKVGTSWLIDTVKVELMQDSQDYYQARVVDSGGEVNSFNYFGIKTLPFSAAVNFQTAGSDLVEGFLVEEGTTFSNKADSYNYGWSYDVTSNLVTEMPTSDPLRTQSARFSNEDGKTLPPLWELQVPNGEYQIEIYLPQSTSTSELPYSLMIEDQLSVIGTQNVGSAPITVNAQVIVNDGRLTLSSREAGHPNGVSALKIEQVSADEGKYVFRRGTGDTNERNTTVLALDGQAGLRSVDLALVSGLDSVPMHYSAGSSDYTVPASEPIANFGTWRGPSQLLTNVTYDFGVSAGDISLPLTGVFGEDAIANNSTPSTLSGFYLVVKDRSSGRFLARLPMTMPEVGTTEWAELIEDGMRKQFEFPQYGLTSWIKVSSGREWNARTQSVTPFNYILTHMANEDSAAYAFQIEAASSIYGQPFIKYGTGAYEGNASTNLLYSLAFDNGQPWRAASFNLSHSGQLLPSSYLGSDPRNVSISQESLSNLRLRELNATNTGAGALLDFSNPDVVTEFAEKYSLVDNAPELKNHPILDQLVADYSYDPIALARFVFNEIEVVDYIGVHPGLTETNIPVEVTLGGLRRDALAVLQEGQGSPREICILLTYILRQCGIPAAIAEPEGANVYLLDQDFSRLVGRNIAGSDLTPKKIPLEYPWVVAYLEGEEQPIQHLFPWLKQTEIVEGADLFDLMPERLNNGFKYFEKFMRADDEVMMIGADGEVDPSVRGFDDDQPYKLWPPLIKKLLRESNTGVSYDEVGIRKINRPQQYARWEDFPRPLDILGQAVLYSDYAAFPNKYDTIEYLVAPNDANSDIFEQSKAVWRSQPIALMDLHNRAVSINYGDGKISVSIAEYGPYQGSPIAYSTAGYPQIGDADYIERAKQAHRFEFSYTATSAKFAFVEHMQRSYSRSIQSQSTLFVNYYGQRNFWNSFSGSDESVFIDDDVNSGIYAKKWNRIDPGEYAFCHQSGGVSTAMLETQLGDLLYYDDLIVNGATEDPEFQRQRLFYLMGQVYWKKCTDFGDVVYGKHKFIRATRKGALHIGMEDNSQAELFYPFIDVFSLSSTGGHLGGTYNLSFGSDFTTAWWDAIHVSHIQASSYEHAILRNLLNTKGAYSTVKVLQEASRAYRADPQNNKDLVVLSRSPNSNGKTWQQEGEVVHQGKKLKDWGMWYQVEEHLKPEGELGQRNADLELCYMPPGPVQIEGVGRMALAYVSYSGGAGMLISGSGDPKNGGGIIGASYEEVAKPSDEIVSIVLEETDNYKPVIRIESDGSISILNYSGTGEEYLSASPELSIFTESDSDFNSMLTRTQNAELYTEINDFLGTGGTGDSVFQVQAGLGSSSGLEQSGLLLNSGSLYAFTADKPETSFNLGIGELVGDPVNVVNGDFYVDTTDLELPGQFPLAIRRNYTSSNVADNGLGFGWRLGFATYLQFKAYNGDPQGIIMAAEMDGSVIAYSRPSSSSTQWTVDIALNPMLKNATDKGIGSTANLYQNYITSNGTDYTLYAVNGEVRSYKTQSFPIDDMAVRSRPYLDSWYDANGNGFTFSYYQSKTDFGYGNLERIDSVNGNFLLFKYNSKRLVSNILTKDGREVTYSYNTHRDLTQVTLPDRSQILYSYELEKNVLGEDASNHLLIREERPLGRILENDYDAQRRVVRQRATVGENDALVENAVYNYSNTYSQIEGYTGYTEVTAVNGGVTRYDYAQGQITKITDAEQFVIEQAWYTDRFTFPDPSANPDSQRTLAELTDANLADSAPGGFSRSMKWIKNKRGLMTYFWYDANGNIVQQKVIGEIDGDRSNGDEVSTTLTQYNASNLPVLSIDALGRQTVFEYNDSSYPFMPTAVEQLTTDSTLISRNTMTYGEVVATGGDAYGLNTENRRAVGTSDESYTLTEYSSAGFPVQITRYTDEDDLINASSGPNLVVNFSYDDRGNMIEQRDQAGGIVRFRHDAMGRPVTTQHYQIVNGVEEYVSATTKQYNPAGDLEWFDGPMTQIQDYSYMLYDGAGRMTQKLTWLSSAKTDGSGVEQSGNLEDSTFAADMYSYDGFGNLVEQIGPNGNTNRMRYNQVGQLLSQTSYAGADAAKNEPLATHTWTYEPGGKQATSVSPIGGTTLFLHTDTGMLRRQENPDGTVVEYRYLLDGRVDRQVLPSQNTVRYAYDDLARTVAKSLYHATGTLLSQTTDFYDRRGNLIQSIDAEGSSFETVFDDLDRAISSSGPDVDAPNSEEQSSSTYIDPFTRSVTVTDASLQTATSQTDVLGRTLSTIISDATGAIVQESYFDYAADHGSVTSTSGSGTDAIRQTVWTDTRGLQVLVQHHKESGSYDFERIAYNAAGQLLLSIDALGYPTQLTYDGLNRLQSETKPDGSTTSFLYNASNQITERIMPGGLTHGMTYDTAGRLRSEQIINGQRPDSNGAFATSRRFTYEYHNEGPSIGKLYRRNQLDDAITDTRTYDDLQRLDQRSLSGTDQILAVDLEYDYDLRGSVTTITQTVDGQSVSIPDVTVDRAYDGYGQLQSEQITQGSTLISSIAQLWDAQGRRSGIRSGRDAQLAPVTALFDATYSYDYSYTAAGRLQQVQYAGATALPSSLGLPYDATYLTNGLLDYANSYGVQATHTYDARGRLSTRSQQRTADSTVLLSESLEWTPRNKIAAYTQDRIGRSWEQQKDYSYNPRGQLIDQNYLTDTSARTDAAYEYDADGLGVLQAQRFSGSTQQNWQGLDLSPLGRFGATTEPYTALTGSATYTASGTAGFADGLQAWHNGEPIALETAPSTQGDGYDWTAELEVSAGPQLLELRLYNPYSSQTIEKRYFTAKSDVLPEITVEYDGSGRIQRRDFSDGRSEVYTWDALGRLWAIEQRNSQNDGYNWSAAYDGIGRRLQTEYFQVLANVPQSDSGQSIYSVYDPQVEFLELGVKVGNAATEWKVFGNDLNGAYGGLHGIGGLLGLHSSNASAVERIVDDVYGHQQGVLNTGSGALSWTTQSYGAYGAFGAELPTLESGSTLASTRGWRGYRTDPTGFIYMGARYYNATEGRFISPDPFGHAASMDLYSFANGDPINFVDQTGRGAESAVPSANSVGDPIGKGTADSPTLPSRIEANAQGTAIQRSGVYVGQINYRSGGLFYSHGSFEGYVVDPVTNELVRVTGSVDGFGFQIGYNTGQTEVKFAASDPGALIGQTGGIFDVSAGAGIGPLTLLGGGFNAAANNTAHGDADITATSFNPKFLDVTPITDFRNLLEKPKVGFGVSGSFQGIRVKTADVIAPPVVRE